MRKPKPVPGETREERAAYFLGGRITVGTIGTFNKRTKCFSTWFVGKVRGRIICANDGRYKFRGPAAARGAAEEFLENCRRLVATPAARA